MHVGWDQESGFSRTVNENDQLPLDDSVKNLLRQAGENPDNFVNNQEEIKFVYEFLDKSGVDLQMLTNGTTTFPVTNSAYHHHQTSNSLAAQHLTQQR